MKKLKQNKDILLPIYIIINILYLLIGSFLFSVPRICSMKLFSYGYIVLLCINIIIIISMFILKKYKKSKIDIFLLIISIASIFSFIFAYDRHVALFGTYYRFEGLFVILYYMSITFLSSFVKEKYKKYIIYLILATGFIELIYACCQKLNLFHVITYVKNDGRHANGFTTNPNFFAILMLLCISITIGLFFDNKDNKKNKTALYLVLISLYMIGLLFANTTSCMVGLICVLIYLIYYCIKDKNYKKLIIVAALVVTITIIINVIGLTNQIQDLNKAAGEAGNIAIGNIRPEYGTVRIYIWEKTLEQVPKHLFFGIGIDNLKYINNGMPIRYWLVVDKCHNEYLQILATMGIFCFIAYLGLYFKAVKDGIKNSLKTKELYLILPVIGYLVQAFFNISVIEVSPLFYIILGLMCDRNIEIKD